MRRIRDVLRLTLGSDLSQRKVAEGFGVSRTPISNYTPGAQNAGLTWPFQNDMTDADLENLRFQRTVSDGRKPEHGWLEW